MHSTINQFQLNPFNQNPINPKQNPPNPIDALSLSLSQIENPSQGWN